MKFLRSSARKFRIARESRNDLVDSDEGMYTPCREEVSYDRDEVKMLGINILRPETFLSFCVTSRSQIFSLKGEPRGLEFVYTPWKDQERHMCL